jgi:hypothetical protein
VEHHAPLVAVAQRPLVLARHLVDGIHLNAPFSLRRVRGEDANADVFLRAPDDRSRPAFRVGETRLPRIIGHWPAGLVLGVHDCEQVYYGALHTSDWG